MNFIAKFEPDDDGFIVTVPAIPEFVTGGATFDEAFTNATDALEVALLTYAKEGIALPKETSSFLSDTSRMLHVSAAVVAKLEFMAAFQKSGLTRVALAERLGKAETEVRRMLNPYHGTKLAALEHAMRVLGKRFVLQVEDAA